MPGNCRIKLVGPLDDFRIVDGGTYTYRSLPDGDYKLRVRTADGTYDDVTFSLPGESFTGNDGSGGDSTTGDSTVDDPIAGAACTKPAVSVSGRQAVARWADGYCVIKLVGPVSDWRKVNGDTHSYDNLPDGDYKFRVRTADGTYADTIFKVGGTTLVSDSGASDNSEDPVAGAACTNPAVSVSGRQAIARWADGYCAIKLVGPVIDWRKVNGDTHSYDNLPDGDYKFRVRTTDGTYVDTTFKVGGTTLVSDSGTSGSLNPAVNISGKDAQIRWSGDPVNLKLIGPRDDFRTLYAQSFAYNNLPAGSYKARVRPKGGSVDDYEDVAFVIR